MTAPINRRRFLAALSAAGSTVVVSCADDSNDGASKNGASSTTSKGANGPTTAARGPAPVDTPTAGLATSPFTLGVASGDPLDTSVILWTRLAIDPLAADGSGGMNKAVDLKWELAADEQFTTIVGNGIVTAKPDFGHSIHLDATDLAPDTWYWYRFSVDSYVSPVGRTRTLPKATASPEKLRLGFASCQDFNGYYPAHRAMAADRLDLVFFLGDYIYEYAGSGSGPRSVAAKETETLGDYRLRYATYKTDRDLQASHASCPWIATWDDHEVENNYADTFDEGGLDDEAFRKRRAAGYRAYYENLPLRLDPPTGPDYRIYRSFTFGRLAQFMVLDGRQYRDDQACDSPQDAMVSASACEELTDDARSMLGTDQESWLLDGLADSSATWNVLAQQTVMSTIAIGDTILNVDQWDGYPAARDRLFAAIDEKKVSNLVVLTGDIHSAGAGTLSRVAADGTRTPIGVEFVGTSITSSSLVDLFPGLAEAIKPEALPGLVYLNVKDHGYCRCTVTPEQWTTEFVVVDNITSADAPNRVDATVIAKAGTPLATKL